MRSKCTFLLLLQLVEQCNYNENKLTNNKYAATNEKSILHYNNKKYALYTCCMMCSGAMNQLAKSNPPKFKKLYIKSVNKKGDLLLKNMHSKKFVK